MACQPNAAKNAPAKPPISVCEEEEGMPYHQVIRFQVIAASRPENIMANGLLAAVIYVSFTDFAMVVATL